MSRTSTLLIGLLIYPAVQKWRLDRQQLGTPAMVLSILLVMQSLHTVEHVAQWIQYHVLGWPLKAASGIISPLNAELVHFSWNLVVLLVVVFLLVERSGQQRQAQSASVLRTLGRS